MRPAIKLLALAAHMVAWGAIVAGGYSLLDTTVFWKKWSQRLD